ncbi:MAG: Dynamin family protein [Deltaproteobacteria bacterium]|nr:Dynamin family protein [Deltaproteobacteria bacterium]
MDSFNEGTPSVTPVAAPDLITLFERSAELIEKLGDDFLPDEERLAQLRERLEGDRFHLAVLGQFKRGKSTFLNALLGEPLLPTAVVPLTAIPTFLRYGPKRSVWVSFEDGEREECVGCPHDALVELLERHVTEERNPENRLGVTQVDVEHPSGLLSHGVVLIDTPGIGSTFRHNTESTINFLSQCDAAFFIVSADPPITEVEVEFLRAVQGHVKHLFFILNKIDYLSSDERKRCANFLKDVIRKQLSIQEVPEIFPVSGRDGLAARTADDEQGWRESGMEAVETCLTGFLKTEKGAILRQAIAAKAGDLLDDLGGRVRLRRRSLETPLEVLEEKLALFNRQVEEAEGMRRTAGDLLAGDRKRVVEFLEEQSGDLREEARSYFNTLVSRELSDVPSRAGLEERAKKAIEKNIPLFFEKHLGELSRDMEKRIGDLVNLHQGRANELLDTVHRTACELFDLAYTPLKEKGTPDRVRKPYWVTHRWSNRLSSIPTGMLDWVLPRPVLTKQVRKRILAEVEDLLMHNVENLRWATLQNIDRTFRRFVSQLDEHLKRTIEGTRNAILHGRERRKEGRDRVAGEIEELLKQEEAIAEITAALRALGALKKEEQG